MSAITNQVQSYASVTRSQPVRTADQPGEPDLFSVQEFLSLAQELFAKLSTCQSKAAQFSALSELVLKYVYNVQP